MPCVGILVLCDLLGSAGADDCSAAAAAFRTEVDDIVGRLYHIEVMLDDEDGIPAVRELLQHPSLTRCASPPERVVAG